ncbi:MAG: hypothetical protein ACPGGL_05010 [Phycisphaerales bacterium]
MDARYTMGDLIQDHLHQSINPNEVREKEESGGLNGHASLQ